MKELIFIIIWIGVCLLIGGTIIPHMNDNVDTVDPYCSTGGLSCY